MHIQWKCSMGHEMQTWLDSMPAYPNETETFTIKCRECLEFAEVTKTGDKIQVELLEMYDDQEGDED